MAGARAALLLTVAVVALFAAAAYAKPPIGTPPPPPGTKYQVIRPGLHKRNQELACDDSGDKQPPCTATCDPRCPDECIVMCPGCKTFCFCDFYPGVSCGDPRFTGGDGNNFYFHGKKDQDFCVVSDKKLHINAHFIGKRNPGMRRDFTWIQALGIRFGDHRLYMGAKKTGKWNNEVDRIELALDGAPIVDIPNEAGAVWEKESISITRTTPANGVRVQLKGVFDIMANVVPITQEDSRIHNYGVTEEDDSLAHFDLGFRFHDLSDDVHGVLGQTYRTDYVNHLDVSSKMPIMGGAPNYVVSDIFATDCAVSRFQHQTAGISMVTARAY